MLGVDPQRFAKVAAWRRNFAGPSLAQLAGELAPPSAPSISINGDQLRVRLDVSSLSTDTLLSAQLAAPSADGQLSAQLGSIEPTAGPQTLTGELPACPCTLNSLQLAAAVGGGLGGTITGAITIEGIDVHGPSGWTALPTQILQSSQWRLG